MNLRTYLMIKSAADDTFFNRAKDSIKAHSRGLTTGGGAIAGGLLGDALSSALGFDDDAGIGATAGALGGGGLGYYLSGLVDPENSKYKWLEGKTDLPEKITRLRKLWRNIRKGVTFR